MKKLLGSMVLGAAGTLMLPGCGGGGGGGDGSTDTAGSRSNLLQGTVATETPMSGVQVEVISTKPTNSSAYEVRFAITDAEGRYSIDVSNLAAPYLVTVRNVTHPVYSRMSALALTGGRANVTPLTDLLVSQLTQVPQDWRGVDFPEMAVLRSATPQAIKAARDKVASYLLARPGKAVYATTVSVNASAVEDFIGAELRLVSGNAYGDLLQQLSQTLLPGENIYGLREDMLNSGKPALDIQWQEPGYVYCDGNICGRSPNGGQTIAQPYLAKFPLVRALQRQLAEKDPLAQLDCGASPAIPGFAPGQNSIVMDGPVVRVNGNGYSLPLTSLVSSVVFNIALDQSGFVAKKYIRSVTGGTNYVFADGWRSITIFFDTQVKIQSIDFHDWKDGTQRTVSCVRT